MKIENIQRAEGRVARSKMQIRFQGVHVQRNQIERKYVFELYSEEPDQQAMQGALKKQSPVVGFIREGLLACSF